MLVLFEACTEPQFVCDEGCGPSGSAVRQLSGGGPDLSAEVSDQEGITLSLYSPEELARKQRGEPAFHWQELCLRIVSLFCVGQKKSATFWSGGSLEWIRRELSGELVPLTLIGS